MDKRLLGAKSKARKARKARNRASGGAAILKKALISTRAAKTYQKTAVRDNKRTRINAKQTKPERIVELILLKHHIKFEKEYKILGMFYDFYLPDNGCLLEIDGTYWHCRDVADNDLQLWQLSRKINDTYKNSIAVVKNFALIRVWEDEIDENKLISEIQEKSTGKRNASIQ